MFALEAVRARVRTIPLSVAAPADVHGRANIPCPSPIAGETPCSSITDFGMCNETGPGDEHLQSSQVALPSLPSCMGCSKCVLGQGHLSCFQWLLPGPGVN